MEEHQYPNGLSSSSDKQHQQPITILGTPDRTFNPLRRLISGFCDPFIPKQPDRDDENTVETSEDVSHPAPTTGGGSRSLDVDVLLQRTGVARTQNINNGHLKISTTASAEADSTLPPNQTTTHNSSLSTVDSVTSVQSFFRPDENEIQFSYKLTKQRRKHALQVILASLVFVVAALMTLQQLGYTSLADFHPPQSSSGFLTSALGANGNYQSWGTGWIQIFEKTSTVVETGGIQTLQAHKKKKDHMTDSDSPTMDHQEEEEKSTTFSNNDGMPPSEQSASSNDPTNQSSLSGNFHTNSHSKYDKDAVDSKSEL